MDFRLEKLKENLESAVKGMSSEQLSWHLPGKWCAAEVLEHLYLTYTGTITGFERVMRKGKPLASQASMAQRALTLVVVRFGHLPAGRKAPPIGPSDFGSADCDTVQKASSGSWTASPETAFPPSRKHDQANGLNAGKRGPFF